MTGAGGKVGVLYVAAGAALFGTVGTAQALGPDAADPTSIGAVRLVLAALVLVAVSARAGLGRMGVCLRLPPVWVAGVAQAAFNVTFLNAVSRVGVAVGTLVAIGCTPIITGLLARHVSRGWLAATSLALVGLVLLLSGDLDRRVTPSGLTFAVGASASYAVFIIASARIGRIGVQTTPVVAAIFVVAAVTLCPVLLTTSSDWVATAPGATMVLYLAVAATVLAYSFFNRGLGILAPSTAATLGLVEPLVASVLGVAVLGERLSVLAWCGALLVLAALGLMVRLTQPVATRKESTA